MHLLRAHQGQVRTLAYSPNGKLLASGGDDRRVRLWNLTTSAETTFLMCHTGCVYALAFSPDGRLLASSGDHNELFLWRTYAGTHTVLTGHPDFVRALAFRPDGRTLAAASGHHMRLWDMESNWWTTTAGVGDGAQALAFDSTGERVAVGSAGQVWLWDVTEGARLTGAKSLEVGTPVHGVVFSTDGAMVAAAAGRTVQVWDARNHTLRMTLRGHTDTIWSITYGRDGRRIFSGSEDGLVKAWDVTTGVERKSYDWRIGNVRAVAVAPDGLTAAAAGDGAIAVWDIED